MYYVSLTQLKEHEMITQNPITGRSRGRLANVYARTLYGKNVLQSCPPPTKGHQHPNQVKACTAFGYVSKLSNQISASVLNYLYYLQPQGRSRRQQWCKDLAKGMTKNGTEFAFDPSMIETLGGNAKVTETPVILTPEANQIQFSVDQLSVIGNVDTTLIPCVLMICPSEQICIDLLSFTTIDAGTITINPLSSTVIGKQCWFYFLWQINVGTQLTTIMSYGSYRKYI